MVRSMTLRTLRLTDLTIRDERSFQHIALYDVLRRMLVADDVRFRVASDDSPHASWSRVLFLNLTFWSATNPTDVLVDASIDADVVAHVAWHHAARKALFSGSSSAASADAMFLGESIASAFDLYLVGRTLGREDGCGFLETQVPTMAEVAEERGDSRSWFAAAASFVGVLVIVRPGFGVFSWEVLLPVVCALSLAFFQACTRALSGRDDARVTAFFGPAVAFCVFSLAMPFNWVMPRSWFDAGLFVALGAIVAGVQVLQTQAYRHGTTHVIAPFTYVGIVNSVWLGWLVFGAVPDAWSFVGMAVIAGAGVAMVLGGRKS